MFFFLWLISLSTSQVPCRIVKKIPYESEINNFLRFGNTMKKVKLTKRFASLDNILVNVDLIDATHSTAARI